MTGCNSRRILAAMLQQQQRIVNQLVDRTMRDDAYNATHGGLLNKNNSKLYMPRKIARQEGLYGARRSFGERTEQGVLPKRLCGNRGHAAQ